MYTEKSLKAYKSLESYNYVLSGLVFDIQVKRINSGNYLNRAKIRHGQSMFTKHQTRFGYVLGETEKFYMDTALAWLVWEKYAPMLEQCFMYF